MGVTQIKDAAMLTAMVVAGFVAWRAYSLGRTIGGGVVEGAAALYADLTSPDIVEPVIRVSSRHFEQNGDLTPEAQSVYAVNFPNFYRLAFDGVRIKPAFSYLIDSGKPVKDSDYKKG